MDYNITNNKEEKNARTLAEEQENDRVKQELALANGIKHYIILDCRVSEINYIKSSILNSELNSLFDLNNIDWKECEKFSLSSLIKEVCEYWNNKEDWESIGSIFENNPWGIKSRGCIRTYLVIGNELGWCNYNGKEELKKSNIRKGKLSGNKVEIFKDGVSLGVFESCIELERQSEELFGTKLWHSPISDVCRNKISQYKGFTFKYI